MEIHRNKVFIDTSAFVAFVLESDPSHAMVLKKFEKCYNAGMTMVTTDYVLDELFTFLRCVKKISINLILSFMVNAYSSGINVFGVSETLFGEAIGLMTKYKDQYFSCTDCVSFSVMKEMKIRDVLTIDKHFTIAGFNSLLSKN
jgi:predicted nucleic acid-binding protein